MDQCNNCERLEECRAAAAGRGAWPECEYEKITVTYNPSLPRWIYDKCK